jgi:hypothetical protein
MIDLLFWAAGLLVVIFLFSKGGSKREKSDGYFREFNVFFMILVFLISFSPLIGAYTASIVGMEVNIVNSVSFIWIGVFLSLPTSLLVSRAFGPGVYNNYWDYLQRSEKQTKDGVVRIWLIGCLGAIVSAAVCFLIRRY